MMAHLRTEAYPVYSRHMYPPAPVTSFSYEANVERIELAKARAGQAFVTAPERAKV